MGNWRSFGNRIKARTEDPSSKEFKNNNSKNLRVKL
jgi:hypothetical protein